MTFDYATWRDVTRRLAVSFQEGFERRYGYPPGEHVVAGPTDPSLIESVQVTRHQHVIPEALVDFYEVCGEVALPDVGNGYFISSLERVLEGLNGDDPVRMRGTWVGPITVFGSDGGGTLFAVDAGRGAPVYALPPGAVHDQTYEDTLSKASTMAEDLPSFLMLVQRAIASA